MDLALNNLQWLICHKTKPNKTYDKFNTNTKRFCKLLLIDKIIHRKMSVQLDLLLFILLLTL